MTFPTNARVKTFDTTIGDAPGKLAVRQLKHSERNACFTLAQCDQPESVHQLMRLRQVVFQAAFVSVEAAAEYKAEVHPVLGRVAPVALFDDVTTELHDEVCRFALPEIFDRFNQEDAAKNSSTPRDGSTAGGA